MSRQRGGSGLIVATLLVAFALALWPLPDQWGYYRPQILVLVLCYWLLEAPDRIGMGAAFLVGLAADLMFGTLLGEQALRLSVIAFLVLRFRPRLRFFTLLQQARTILLLLLNDRVVVLMVRALSGEGMPGWQFWVAPFIGAALWPWLYVLLDDIRLRLRSRDSE